MSFLILVVTFLTLAIGASVLWNNPRRFTNQAFALASATATAWLLCFFMAMRAGLKIEAGGEANPLPWVRAASAVGAFFPLIIWCMKESILTTAYRDRRLIKGALSWFFIGCCLASLTLDKSFVFDETGSSDRSRGVSYLLFSATILCLFLVLIHQTYKQWRAQTGIRRLEIQFLILNAGIACFLAVLVTAAGSFFDLRFLSRLVPLIILVFYALTAWAISIHRIFDARQVFFSFGQRAGIIVSLSAGILAGWKILGQILPPPTDLIISVAGCSTIAFWLDRHSRNWLKLNVWQNTTAIRQEALERARREPDPNKLVTEFETLLRGWCHTNFAALLFDSGEVFVSTTIELAKDRTGYASLCRQGWSTPESLQRLRPEPGLVDLRQFLTEFNLGIIVSAPRDSTTPSLLLALGVKENFRPFTYPEVQQLQEVAEFMDNILARSRLSMQARQSEQLATIGLIGASLAHEIRNPLVSIKTFSHLLASRFDDPEFRRRFSVLIPAEVERIDSLTQQLLDLSNPRRHQMDRISLHPVMQETIELMHARAQDANVTLIPQLDADIDIIYADAGAIRQVIINLIINALQALDGQEGERNIWLRSRNAHNAGVILEISDNGPGIPADQRARLFHPFVSTKTKGMGLGLAVCADILHEHRATIIVPDKRRPGATFRITFPCPPPSS